MALASVPCRVVVLISGRGSNLQSLIDGRQRGELPIELRAAISDEPGAAGLGRATRADIPTSVVAFDSFPRRADFERALADTTESFSPDLVVLAGFMRILSNWFVDQFAGRMLNIHPSLLPNYPGLNTHRRAIAAGDSEHGASVHFVTRDLDGGPVIVQARVPVCSDDTPERLAERVLAREHQILPLAVRWYAQNKLSVRGSTVYFEGQPLPGPMLHRPNGVEIRE